MQAQTLINYIKNPALLDKESVPQLQKLAQDFPYFQGAHILLSLASKKWNASVHQQSLKKTAIVISNRAHLFNLIEGLGEENTNNITVEITQTQINNEKTQTNITEIEALKTSLEDIKHELNILKATDVVTETITLTEVKPITNEELIPENLEKEIEKAVVNAYIEKEIIATAELNNAETLKPQPENFTDWLQLLKKNNGPPFAEKNTTVLKTNKQLQNEQTFVEVKKQKQKALIDKIIEANPGAIKNKEEKKFFTPITQAKESLIENEHLITETLAKIYAMQGSVNKAVRAYEILSLKFPQKSAYFASLIKNLKENQ